MDVDTTIKPRRVIITGSRDWHCRQLASRVVTHLMNRHWEGGLIIVHGAAPGVDSAFADACNDLGVIQEPHPADWNKFGKRAGPLRNQAMIEAGADLCLAFHPKLSTSKGTGDMVRRALKAGIPTWWAWNETERPVRQALPGTMGETESPGFAAQAEGSSDACRAKSVTVEPSANVAFVAGYNGPVFHPTGGFAGSPAALLAKYRNASDGDEPRPTWAYLAAPDPDGVIEFDRFLRDIQEEYQIDTSRLDPASVEELRAAFGRFNEVNRGVAPMTIDFDRAVRLAAQSED